jgi:hypothetical protein
VTRQLPFLMDKVWSVCNDFYNHVLVFVCYESLAMWCAAHVTLQFSHKPFRFLRLSYSKVCIILPLNLKYIYIKSAKNVS